jgi:hypothetical protein
LKRDIIIGYERLRREIHAINTGESEFGWLIMVTLEKEIKGVLAVFD